jgi:hypothetical protein
MIDRLVTSGSLKMSFNPMTSRLVSNQKARRVPS